ncbi:MAG: hypothetical protein F6K04_01710 [Leptolyngbya sp. SIO4C5]|nr:hypothetical protein [Leptolyngbya sp. SIO4C5]
MVKLWLLCFVLIFALAEGYQWVMNLDGLAELELPLAIAGGMLLAIASNRGRRRPVSAPDTKPAPPDSLAPTSPDAIDFIPACLDAPSTQTIATADSQTAQPSAPKSISFEIQKPRRLQWQTFKQPPQPHRR